MEDPIKQIADLSYHQIKDRLSTDSSLVWGVVNQLSMMQDHSQLIAMTNGTLQNVKHVSSVLMNSIAILEKSEEIRAIDRPIQLHIYKIISDFHIEATRFIPENYNIALIRHFYWYVAESINKYAGLLIRFSEDWSSVYKSVDKLLERSDEFFLRSIKLSESGKEYYDLYNVYSNITKSKLFILKSIDKKGYFGEVSLDLLDNLVNGSCNNLFKAFFITLEYPEAFQNLKKDPITAREFLLQIFNTRNFNLVNCMVAYQNLVNNSLKNIFEQTKTSGYLNIEKFIPSMDLFFKVKNSFVRSVALFETLTIDKRSDENVQKEMEDIVSGLGDTKILFRAINESRNPNVHIFKYLEPLFKLNDQRVVELRSEIELLYAHFSNFENGSSSSLGLALDCIKIILDEDQNRVAKKKLRKLRSKKY